MRGLCEYLYKPARVSFGAALPALLQLDAASPIRLKTRTFGRSKGDFVKSAALEPRGVAHLQTDMRMYGTVKTSIESTAIEVPW
jgi:hypothetical protein